VISRQTLIAFFTSVVLCFVLASLFNTQFVIAGLRSVGVAVPLSDQMVMSWYDLIGLAPTYGVVILVGLLIAFLVMRQVEKRTFESTYWYAFGGALTFIVIVAAMQPILGITLITGARSILGWSAQCLSGALAGVWFAWCFHRSKNKAP
jgi:zinc transporter ZupT